MKDPIIPQPQPNPKKAQWCGKDINPPFYVIPKEFFACDIPAGIWKMLVYLHDKLNALDTFTFSEANIVKELGAPKTTIHSQMEKCVQRGLLKFVETIITTHGSCDLYACDKDLLYKILSGDEPFDIKKFLIQKKKKKIINKKGGSTKTERGSTKTERGSTKTDCTKIQDSNTDLNKNEVLSAPGVSKGGKITEYEMIRWKERYYAGEISKETYQDFLKESMK